MLSAKFPPEDAVDYVVGIAGEVLSRRYFIGAVGLLGASVLYCYSLFIVPTYRATAVVIPAATEGLKVPSLGGALGGLVSLAGADLSGGDRRSTVALARLRSRAFALEFLEAHHVFEQAAAQAVVGFVRLPWERAVSGDDSSLQREEVSDFFRSEVLKVVEQKNSGLIEITIVWSEPDEAAQLANKLVRYLNAESQLAVVQEAERTIKHALERIEQSSSIEVRRGLFALVEEQSRRAASASIQEEFAFQFIDPAVAPKRAFRPRKALLALTGLLCGVFFCFFLITVQYHLKVRQHGRGRT